MIPIVLQQAIEKVRATEHAGVVVLLRQSRELALVVAAWSSVIVRRAAGVPVCAPEEGLSRDALVRWIWTPMSVDLDHAARVFGWSRLKTQRIIERAILLGLVYPDGSVHAAARVAAEASFSEQSNGEGRAEAGAEAGGKGRRSCSREA